ncbi:3-oxo-behenoyl-CoA reductase [Aureococcus anophagefferens]|nr:3-oxo-behenoyl-CoA reductase [Aureococcus anophagefferens]
MPSDKKVCVVVGLGNKGIGDHCAKQWAAEGFAVAMLARRAEVLAELEKEIPGSRAFPCDVTDQAQVEATVKRIAAELGPVDVCISTTRASACSSRSRRRRSRSSSSAGAAAPAGLYLFAKAILPGMASRGGGVFGVTGATASWRGVPKTPAFASAKFGVRALAQALAKDYAPKGIHIFHCIIDGVVNQPRTKAWFPADKPDDEFLSPATIAKHYWDIAAQEKSCWTFESNRSGIALARFLQATGLEVYQRHLGERLGRAAFAKDQHLLRLAVEEKKRVDPHFREVFNEAFGQISYWDETYAKRDSHFDWFVSFDDVRGILEPLLPNKNAKILIPGCGDAPFTRDLCVRGGYARLVNVDASEVVVARMRAAEASLPGTVEWHAMDARALTFESESHDAVIDKALLDCVLCSDDKAAAAEVLAEFHRVLRPGGTLVLFSAHTRASLERTFASQAGWCFGHLGIESEDAGKPFLLSVVICEKHAAGVAEKACQAAFEARIEALFGA